MAVRYDVEHKIQKLYQNAQESICGLSIERRGSVVVSTSAWHAAVRGSIPGPGGCHIWCKNLALYIRDCVSLSLRGDIKFRRSTLSGV